MNKLIFFLMVAVIAVIPQYSAFAALTKPVSKTLEHGFVQIYDFGTIKLHAYQTSDPMLDECFILETNTNLVAIESPPFSANIADWKQYITDLNKPLTDILISAHPGGGYWYGDAKSHATENTINALAGGATKALTESLKNVFGADFNAEIPEIKSTLKNGENNIGGITLEIIDTGDSYDIVIPALQTIYTHMLGADTHSILAGKGHSKMVVGSLESMKTNGYRLILSSHHTPEYPPDVDTKITYVQKVQTLVEQSHDKEDFVSRVKREFPDYEGLNYLEMTAGYFFQK